VKRTLSYGLRRFDLEHRSARAREAASEGRHAAGAWMEGPSAAAMLERLFAEPGNSDRIRRFLAEAEAAGPPGRLDEEEVRDAVSRLLRDGWALLREVSFEAPDLGSGEEQEAPPPSSARAARLPLTWIEIRLIGEDDEPIPRELYRIELPDGSIREGRLDDDGLARLDGIDPGSCVVTFPALDEEAWTRA
jgi:hypothetical protein